MKLNYEHVRGNLYYSAITGRHYLYYGGRYHRAEMVPV
jgi:hypothetical protein